MNYYVYQYNLNHWLEGFRDSVLKAIEEYKAESNEDEKIGVILSNDGQQIEMVLEEIQCISSNVVAFKGWIDGSRAIFYQHVNQLGFLLTTIKSSVD